MEIKGHPAIVAPNANDDELRFTVCAECGRLRSILFLTGDRWYCTVCRNAGVAKPSRVRVPFIRR